MFQKILIYDPDPSGIECLKVTLAEHGFNIETDYSVEDARKCLEHGSVDLFIISLHKKSEDTHQLLRDFKANRSEIPFIFAMDYDDNMTITNHYEEALCFHDIRFSDLDETIRIILNALHHLHRTSEVHERISSAYDKIKRAIPRIISSKQHVLVVGDTGTGKSYFAQSLHNRIYDDNKTCMFWNAETCKELEAELFGAAYIKRNGGRSHIRGIFEQSEGSVLFIEGCTKLTTKQQKLLKSVLESGVYRMVGDSIDRELKCRIVLGAGPEIDKMLKDGSFDRGLYNLVVKNRVDLPSLREASEDIMPMAKLFVHEYCERMKIEEPRITAAAMRYLQKQMWFDNLRELKVCVEQAVDHHHGHNIYKTDFIAVTHPAKKRLSKQSEREKVEEALIFCKGNVTAACERAEMSRSTYIRKLGIYGIDPNNYRQKRYNCGKKEKQSA